MIKILQSLKTDVTDVVCNAIGCGKLLLRTFRTRVSADTGACWLSPARRVWIEKMNLWRQGKKQRVRAQAFVDSIEGRGFLHIFFEEVLEVGRISIDLARVA